MLKAVFISDLHLEVGRPDILARFDTFLTWFAVSSAQDLYILGDFFHVWFGDDLTEPFAADIAQKLLGLHTAGKRLWFMPGNRDFLLGPAFAAKAGMHMLQDPSAIDLGGESVLLAHGDAYCTEDKKHMRFRAFTRHPWVQALYWRMPKSCRQQIVRRIRARSESSRQFPPDYPIFNTVAKAMLANLRQHRCHTLIHGHTHKPGKITLDFEQKNYSVWVLSDWDDTPEILCYDDTKGLYYTHILEAS